MPAAIVLTVVDGVRIVVPDSLFLITPYVLQEGQNVIDIGANYGVYTLPMAKKVGASGHVWAFEPAAATAQFLSRGIAENGFGNVTLEQKAISRASGRAQLAFHAQAELRSIIHAAAGTESGEDVAVVTLDESIDRLGWKSIDLIKIDAEGEETNIIVGGSRFFATLSPLVQYELNSAGGLNLDLIRQFAAIGYDSYRLVPGLNLLVPFDAESPPDPYLLNLFCCKADRAERLEAGGFLLRSAELMHVSDPPDASASSGESPTQYDWRHAIAHLPYAAQLAPQWELTEQAGESPDVHRALACYARSRDDSLPKLERFRALESSFMRLRALCDREPLRLRLASLARVANEYGERAVAVSSLSQLADSIRRTRVVDPNEPFLAPLERFDSLPPGEALGNWIQGAVLEQLERRERFSSFYVGPSALDRLETIHALGFGGAEMERRLELVRRCIAQATAAKSQARTTHVQ
jgi:FkbM family methyltransferase